MSKIFLSIISLSILSACSNKPACDSDDAKKILIESIDQSGSFRNQIISSSSQYATYTKESSEDAILNHVLSIVGENKAEKEYQEALASCLAFRDKISDESLANYINSAYEKNEFGGDKVFSFLFAASTDRREVFRTCATKAGRIAEKTKVENSIKLCDEYKKNPIKHRSKSKYCSHSSENWGVDYCESMFEQMERDVKGYICTMDNNYPEEYQIKMFSKLKEIWVYRTDILPSLYAKYTSELPSYNERINTMAQQRASELAGNFLTLKKNAPPVKYSLSEIITRGKNESTGAVFCSARLSGGIDGWGSVDKVMSYTVEVDSEKKTYVSIN